METFKRFFAAPVFEADEDKTNRARLLHIILIAQSYVLIVLIISSIIAAITADQKNTPQLFLIIFVLFVSFIWRLLMLRGFVNAASAGLIITFLAVLILILAMSGTIRSIGAMFFPIVLLMATVLIGKRAGLIFFVITAALGVGLVLGEVWGLLPAPRNTISLNSTVSVIASLGLTCVLLYLASQGTENALKRSSQNELQVRLLAETLEQNVSDRTTQADAARIEADEAQAALRAQLDEINALSRLSEAMRGEQDVVVLSQNILRQLCLSLNAQMGAIFIREEGVLRMMGSYAYTRRKNAVNAFHLGEGLVGQAALEKQPIIITNPPADYVSVASGMLEIAPRNIMAIPFQHNGMVLGVIELATLNDFTPAQTELLERALESIAISFSTAQARTQINALLKQTQRQTNELRIREAELKTINEELQVQAKNLQASQDKLRRQQTDLQAANTELEERTTTLQQQRTVLDEQNRDLTAAQGELQRQAKELIQANKYKSEFLANMSHELRTPLNSLLILSRMFANNEGGNLTKDQVESAQVIYNSGSDLLSLINEILDLSKVEAGQMTFHFDQMPLEHLIENMRLQFEHLATEKKLTFEVALAAAGLPEEIETDHQRVEQVLKNLLSNAFKFTSEGTVRLLIEPAAEEMVAIRVHDSGIGMTPDQQKRVFEAFQQADGSTSRKYGGTGLGLTISREMATRLGGRIGLESELGKGSTFTLYLPIHQPQAEAATAPAAPTVSDTATKVDGQPVSPALNAPAAANDIVAASDVDDDRSHFKTGDKLLLVIEDDTTFAKLLFDYAHKKGFKCLIASNGEDGLKLAAQHPPDAILLDLHLPGMSGWQVLDTLKGTANLRHIPVHILSASEETTDLYKRGALGFLSKPVSQDGLEHVFAKIGEFLSRDIKSLLLIEDDQNLRHSVRQLLGGRDVKITDAVRGDEAIALLHEKQFDCIILDINLPDMTGFEFLSHIDLDNSIPKCPVIVYTGKVLSEEEHAQLLKYADSVIIKGVKSPERLLDETALFLHRVVANMPAEKQEAIRRLHDRDNVFSGKHILVVDDDMRNAFALSRLLNARDLRVTIARSGAKALETLATTTDIDLVLMDIMMPEMDGYETMQKVRAQPKFKELPILALTAKAMKGDMEKCIEAGANDYLSKPIDSERLFSMLRVWLYK